MSTTGTRTRTSGTTKSATSGPWGCCSTSSCPGLRPLQAPAARRVAGGTGVRLARWDTRHHQPLQYLHSKSSQWPLPCRSARTSCPIPSAVDPCASRARSSGGPTPSLRALRQAAGEGRGKEDRHRVREGTVPKYFLVVLTKGAFSSVLNHSWIAAATEPSESAKVVGDGSLGTPTILSRQVRSVCFDGAYY